MIYVIVRPSSTSVAAYFVDGHILPPATIRVNVHGTYCRRHISSLATIFADVHGTNCRQSAEQKNKNKQQLRDDDDDDDDIMMIITYVLDLIFVKTESASYINY